MCLWNFSDPLLLALTFRGGSTAHSEAVMHTYRKKCGFSNSRETPSDALDDTAGPGWSGAILLSAAFLREPQSSGPVASDLQVF